MPEFKKLNKQVQTKFAAMTKGASTTLFTVDLEKDVLWNLYLNGIDESIRQQYRCNTCRQFINNYGGVVTIDPTGKVSSIWDFDADTPFTESIKAMRDAVHAAKIYAPLVVFSTEHQFGCAHSRQRVENDGKSYFITWDHFSVEVGKNVNKVLRGETVESIIGKHRTNHGVIVRSLDEITPEAVTDVLDLIKSNAIYRGQEFKNAVTEFKKKQAEYKSLPESQRDAFAWNLNMMYGIRNTAIGSLLTDLSEGRDLESAVASYESKVSPANYRRTTALVTPRMVDDARKALEQAGYLDSIRRRHATKDDVSFDNVLYVNRAVGKADASDPFAMASSTAMVDLRKVESSAKKISLESFIASVIPTAKKVELLITGDQNYMSLTAPAVSGSANMFAWDNPIGWAYHNGNADAIREKVKKAGGNITAPVRVSLAWYNYDDLDLSVIENRNCEEICFHHKRSHYSGGHLDVDMNVGPNGSRSAVENIVYPDIDKMGTGEYEVYVKNFTKREAIDVGFEIEVEINGQISNFKHTKALANGKKLHVGSFTKQNGVVTFKPNDSDMTVGSGRTVNGVDTSKFADVSHIMYSPNHWGDNAVGNKHIFFIIDGMVTDKEVRPFFNEFLSPELTQYRKVMEVVAGKSMVETSQDQMTGVGFSLTQNIDVILRVDGKVYSVKASH